MPAPATSSRHLYTGHHQGHEQAAPWLTAHHHQHADIPEPPTGPGFYATVISHDASAVVHTRSSSRRTPDPLIAGLLHSRFPPRLLTGMTLRWFGISACTANPEGLPPSLAQHGSCRRPSTSPSLSFQDTRGCREPHPRSSAPRFGGLVHPGMILGRGLRLLFLTVGQLFGWLQRIHGEFAGLGIRPAPSTVWEILTHAGILQPHTRGQTCSTCRSDNSAMTSKSWSCVTTGMPNVSAVAAIHMSLTFARRRALAR